jgi:hypothetical protein
MVEEALYPGLTHTATEQTNREHPADQPDASSPWSHSFRIRLSRSDACHVFTFPSTVL